MRKIKTETKVGEQLDKSQFRASKYIHGPHWRPLTKAEKAVPTRDRTLAGKKRRLARKAANRGHRSLD